MLARVAAQQIGFGEYRGGQALIGGLSGGGAFGSDLGDAFVEGWQGGGSAGAEPVPVILGAGQQVAQTADQRQQAFGVGLLRRGQHALQPVSGAHNGQRFAAGGGAGGLIQGLAHGVVGNFSFAFDQFLDLGTEAQGKLFGPGGIGGIGQAAGGQRVQHAERNPPVGARSRIDAGHFDHGDRNFHFRNALGIVLDPLQQATFKAETGGLEAGGERIGGKRGDVALALGWALRQIREKQFGGARCRQAACDGHGAVGRQQLERLVRMTGHEVVEVGAQDGDATLNGRHGAIGAGLAVDQRSEALLDGIGEFGQPIKADDGQRTVCLMQRGTGFIQCGRVS